MLTKKLVRRFGIKHCKTSFVEPKDSKPFHELERSILPTPLLISIEGDRNMHDALPRERSPLLEEPSSIDEDMEVPPSRVDQDQGSLIDDEAFSHINEEDEHRRANNIVPLGGDPSPHGDGRGSIASIRGALVSLQGVPNDLTCGNQGTIPEQHVLVFVDCEKEEEKDQHQGMMSIHPYLFWEVSTQNKETVLCS